MSPKVAPSNLPRATLPTSSQKRWIYPEGGGACCRKRKKQRNQKQRAPEDVAFYPWENVQITHHMPTGSVGKHGKTDHLNHKWTLQEEGRIHFTMPPVCCETYWWRHACKFWIMRKRDWKTFKKLSKIMQMFMLSIINVHVVDYQELLQKCFRDLDKSVSHEKHGVSSS